MSKRTLFIGLVLLCVISAIAIYLAQKSPVGYWYGFVKGPDLNLRFALTVEKDAQGKLSCYMKVLDGSIGTHGPMIAGVSITGRSLGWENSDGSASFHLDWTGDVLQGTSKAVGYDEYPVFLRRGMNYLVPRVGSNGKAQTDYNYHAPRKMSDGWETSDLRQERVDLEKIESGIKAVLDQAYMDIHSVVVVHRGKLVLDEYFYGYGPNDEHQLASVTKSVFSALFGIAVDKGWVSPDQRLYDFYPEYRSKPGWNPKKNRVTLGNLISMSSSFDCNDMPHPTCIENMWKTPDWSAYALSIAMINDPGKQFIYCNPCLCPVGEILVKKSGLSIPDFAQKYLYDPLEVQAPHWMKGPRDATEVATGHWLRPRDMAKIGYLFLNKGQWKGKQIISEKWVEKATEAKVKLPDDQGQEWSYGYLWWLKSLSFHGKNLKSFSAQGAGGQFIWAVPELDLVVIITSGNWDAWGLAGEQRDFFEKYIVNALL